MELLFRAYDKTDSLLGVITEATAKRVSVHYNGPGVGSFRINRHSSEFAWTAAGNYVRVYIDSTSNDPIFGFFIESGSDDVVSKDEQGGEEVQRGGRGALAYLERAIIDASSTYGRFRDTSWTWTDPTQGQIVQELLDDAMNRGALPFLSWDFDETTESGGGTWDAITGIYELPVGLDLLQALARQQSAGLVATMSPDFVLSASEVIGTDLSATIGFTAGVNISEEVTREVLASAAKSRMLVQGTTANGNPFFQWVVDAGVETALGDRREGFLQYQATKASGMIDKVGAQAIARLKRRFDGLSVLGVLTDVHVPFTDYQPGDSVKVNVAGVWTNLVAPITSIVLFDSANGEADCALEFEDIAFEPLQLKDRSDADPNSGGSGGGGGGSGGGGGGASNSGCGGCPEFTDDDPPTVFDDMNRTNGSAWGQTSSLQGTWVGQLVGSADPPNVTFSDSMAPTRGVMKLAHPSAPWFGSGEERIAGPGFWSTGDWRVRTSVRFMNANAKVWDLYVGDAHVGFGTLIGPDTQLRVDYDGTPVFVELDRAIFDGGGFVPIELRKNGSTITAVVAGLSVSAGNGGTLTGNDDLVLAMNGLADVGGAGAEVQFGPIDVATSGSAPNEGQSFSDSTVGDGVTTTFLVAYGIASIDAILVDGVDVTSDVTSSGASYTFTHAPPLGSAILARLRAA